MIKADNLSRIYHMGTVDVRALRGVSFEIERGEFVGIMGPSGSGKSTLLHVLGLLDEPTTGSLTVDDVDVLALSERERTRFRLARLGYVFQDYALIGELTALENVFLTSLVRGAGRDEYLRTRGDPGRVGLADRPTTSSKALGRRAARRDRAGARERPDRLRGRAARTSTRRPRDDPGPLRPAQPRPADDRDGQPRGQHRRYFCRVIHLKDGLVDRVEEHLRLRGDAADEDIQEPWATFRPKSFKHGRPSGRVCGEMMSGRGGRRREGMSYRDMLMMQRGITRRGPTRR
jgi:putative ABC transport system ATP-binding protein